MELMLIRSVIALVGLAYVVWPRAFLKQRYGGRAIPEHTVKLARGIGLILVLLCSFANLLDILK